MAKISNKPVWANFTFFWLQSSTAYPNKWSESITSYSNSEWLHRVGSSGSQIGQYLKEFSLCGTKTDSVVGLGIWGRQWGPGKVLNRGKYN